MPKRKPPKPPRKKQARRLPRSLAAQLDPNTYDGWHGALTETERRVDDIVQKMQSGAWLSGVSERALAKEWNVSPFTVRGYAVEASRMIRRTLRTDPAAREEARAAVMQTFEVIRAKAMGKGDPQSLRVALDATRALGFYMGVEPPKQLDIGRREDPFEGWTTDEKLAFSRDGSRPRRAVRAVLSEPSSAPRVTAGNGHARDDDDGGGAVH
jgi:hypothetical protein